MKVVRIRILLILLAVVLFEGGAHAQEEPRERTSDMHYMLGVGSGQTTVSASYQTGWKFGEKKRLVMGVGIRANAFFASGKYFVTAPAKLVKGEAGPAALFKEPIPGNMDSVHFSSAQAYSLNILIHIRYDFTEKFKAGFNIDVIGASFGGSRSGTYINGNDPGNTNLPVSASPSGFNLLLVGENDLGSLNSEFFVTYAMTDKWALKAGVQHLFMEFTTSTKVQQFPEPNDRFRITPTVVCAGVVYTIR